MAAILRVKGNDYVVYWLDGYVKLSINNGTATNAFALTDESGLDIVEYPDGRLCIVYQDAARNPQRKYSRDNGGTWTAT